jgi:hypothetical protein
VLFVYCDQRPGCTQRLPVGRHTLISSDRL